MILSRFQREISVAVVYALLLVVLAVAAPSFFAGNQFQSVLVTSAPLVVAAVGMTLVILARQIDISIGSQFCVCGISAGLLAKTGLPMPFVALAYQMFSIAQATGQDGFEATGIACNVYDTITGAKK